MDFVIARVTPDDAVELLEHLKIAGGETDNLTFGAEGLPVTVEQERQHLATQPECFPMFAARVDGRIVGNIGLHGSTRERMKHRLSFGLSVEKAYWGKGIGSALLQTLIDFARENGFAVISLEVRSDNARAIALYQKFGFEKTGAFPGFMKIGGRMIDFDLMLLRL